MNRLTSISRLRKKRMTYRCNLGSGVQGPGANKTMVGSISYPGFITIFLVFLDPGDWTQDPFSERSSTWIIVVMKA